ncbi:MAG TPA: hypothetical protein VHC41_01390 [Mycobacteriales bacterium]|jgi:hypothetical protein|nr:hypothetical protein [Mycobacteriales bacterium]
MAGRLRRAWDAQRPGPDVRAVLARTERERMLAWGRTERGEPVVATDRGLWAYGEQLAWTEIDQVRWDEPDLAITAMDGETRRLRLGQERDLPAVIRAQVDASVIASRALRLLPDGRGATVAARRGVTGQLTWQVRYDAGVPSQDPAVVQRVEELIAGLRVELGI